MADPKPTYAHLVAEIRDRHPQFAYIHLMEPPQSNDPAISNDFIREIWGERALISAGGYSDTRESGFRAAEEKGDIIAYSRAFIANVGVPLFLPGASADAFLSLTFRAVSYMVSLFSRATARNIMCMAAPIRLGRLSFPFYRPQ